MPQKSCSLSSEYAPWCLVSKCLAVSVGILVFGGAQLLVASHAAANPLKAFFSIFEKKEKPRPAPVIITPSKPAQTGRRVLNPFIGPGVATSQQSAVPKPKTFNTGRRTMCVRLCDGYYWPMKRGGSNNSLMTDSQKCESQCTSQAKLFVLRSSTDNIGEMRDLSGKMYKRLKNAFAYRQTFNPSCRCKAEPWSERARLRHKRYAAVGRERKVLAIRAIRMDLRSTIQPGVDPKLVLTSNAAVSKRLNTPDVPVRKPVRLAAPEAAAEMQTGSLLETSSQADGVTKQEQNGAEHLTRLPAGRIQSRIGAELSGVRVLTFGDFESQVPHASRIPAQRTQSRLLRKTTLRSARLPIGLHLRPRID